MCRHHSLSLSLWNTNCRERQGILEKLFLEAPKLPGVERLIKHLKAEGIYCCVATSSMTRHFELKSQNHGDLFDLFDHVVTGDQVTKGKPDPEIFIKAAAQYDPVPAPDQCLVFEDAIVGVGAAKAARMHCVMVPDHRLDLSGVDLEGVEVLKSLLDFDPTKYGIAAFPSDSD